MRIGLVTTTEPERCGVRTYSEELVKNATRDNDDITFKLIGRPFEGRSIIERTADCDVVHVNHVNSLFSGLLTEHIHELKARGIKTVCTYNDCTGENRSGFTLAFDRVVVHQPTGDGFQYLKHGVPWTDLPAYSGTYREYIGTMGFPFGFKNYPLAAQLAKAVGKKLLAFLPASNHEDVTPVEQGIMRTCPGSIVNTSFPTHEEMLRDLSQCAFSLFPYAHTGTGVGGSARLGIGAQRPVIISRVIRFADILHEAKYRDEFYIIDDPYPTFGTALPVVEQVIRDIDTGVAKIPVKTLEDMSWKESARQYVEIYRELTAVAQAVGKS